MMRIRNFLDRQNSHLLLALVINLAYHGGLLFFTFKRTYDAYVHIFFADHYARAWFDHWEYRWYTGFTMTSYPPGSQQSVALLSSFIGLQNGFIVVQVFSLSMVIIGIYRFSKVWVSEEAAGYAALLTVFASSINETVHVFGQLPTTFSLGFLLNALPYAYRWLADGRWRFLFAAWILNAATTAGHHVTTLFGAVFFMGPVFALAIVEKFRIPLPDEPTEQSDQVTRQNLKPLIIRRLRRIIPVTARSTLYGVGLILILVLVVLPYWLWSASDPITQVSIPHASRDSFIENTAAGLVFWVIPYGVSLLLLPYVVYKGATTKAWPLILSWGLLFFLGTGGTTPFPRMLLGGAFDILTLDRFTFWATILQLPLLGEFVCSLRNGRLARYLQEQFGHFSWRFVQSGLLVSMLIFAVFVVNLTQFRVFQPEPIDTDPIVTFMEKDQHWRWRYLALGFGDQLAWLSAQMTATTVDGNYHSARRLPELTTTPVERLEGAKFRGIPGIGSLQQFLAVPDKYNLKFVFSNDQFYDPLLYFSGWHRVQRLENGIMVWEREDIPPLPEILPRKEIPFYQRLLWGLVPMSAIAVALLMMLFDLGQGISELKSPSVRILRLPRVRRLWLALDIKLRDWSFFPGEAERVEGRWQVWLDWGRKVRWPNPAPPSAKLVRNSLLVLIFIVLVGTAVTYYRQKAQTPEAMLIAYYDDLDFRRFSDAYERLDPATKPDYDQYLLELSSLGGLLASYAKLDNIYMTVISEEPDRVVLEAEIDWITSLNAYHTTATHILYLRNGRWFLKPPTGDISTPPDQFYRRGEVAWLSQQRRQVTTETTGFSDVQDRPELEILSARLVRVNGRYSVVGELINTEVDPADVTVTALLYDASGQEMTRYNGQVVMMHKLFPKEATPFRIDFEGVAGAVLTDTVTAGEFQPDAFSPVELEQPIATFEVYAKAVVTGRDLDRNLSAQNLEFTDTELHGDLFNSGVSEATIPHVLITHYDENGSVAWVDHYYVPVAVRPQRSQSFALPITMQTDVITILDKGAVYANALQEELPAISEWPERIDSPPEWGYTTMRINAHYFMGASQ